MNREVILLGDFKVFVSTSDTYIQNKKRKFDQTNNSREISSLEEKNKVCPKILAEIFKVGYSTFYLLDFSIYKSKINTYPSCIDLITISSFYNSDLPIDLIYKGTSGPHREPCGAQKDSRRCYLLRNQLSYSSLNLFPGFLQSIFLYLPLKDILHFRELSKSQLQLFLEEVYYDQDFWSLLTHRDFKRRYRHDFPNIPIPFDISNPSEIIDLDPIFTYYRTPLTLLLQEICTLGSQIYLIERLNREEKDKLRIRFERLISLKNITQILKPIDVAKVIIFTHETTDCPSGIFFGFLGAKMGVSFLRETLKFCRQLGDHFSVNVILTGIMKSKRLELFKESWFYYKPSFRDDIILGHLRVTFHTDQKYLRQILNFIFKVNPPRIRPLLIRYNTWPQLKFAYGPFVKFLEEEYPKYFPLLED